MHYKQKDYDILRQNLIKNYGIKIVRFKNSEVLTDIKNVLKVLKNHLTSPFSIADGEGR